MLPPSGNPAVLVMGAGSVGCFVGGRLAASGADVRMVGRPRVVDSLRTHGLRLTDLDGGDLTVSANRLKLLCAPETPAALVLLCVKSGDTADAARLLAASLPAGTPVLSLQNGVSNAETGAKEAPELQWIPGMVPFNIAELSPGHFHRGTAGMIAAQNHPALTPWLPAFAQAGLPLRLHEALAPVQWGKLLLNLNNPVNALSGQPLRAQLLDRHYRTVLAALQEEALQALSAARIRPAAVAGVSPWRLPTLLRLPTWAFRVLAARMLRIDDQARSSMADDLAKGRPTEVDALCGAVVRLAKAQGVDAPLNARMMSLLAGRSAQAMSGRSMRRALGI
jgi:2-dehydropantoate 2-reductase